MDKSIIESYPCYESYKDSGYDWIGQVPSNWKDIPNKYVFNIINNKVGKKSDNYVLLSLTLQGIIKRDMINAQGKFPAEFDTYQEVKKNDFVFCLFDVEETPRTVGLSDYNGMITGAYTVFRAYSQFDERFIYYYYLNLDLDKRFKPLYRGLRNTIPKDWFMSFKTYFPNKMEQTGIAKFLDKKTLKIDKAIELKQQQIKKLEEYKQIVIQNAVTKGLNPDVPMKDSGVDWIGEIPEHWQTNRLGVILSEVSSKNHPDLPLLSITREKGVIKRDIEDYDSNHNYIPDDLAGYKKIVKGQFGMNKMKAWQGSYGVSKYTGIISPAYYVFDIAAELNKDFFSTAIRSRLYINYFRSASDGVRIGQWDLNKVRMKAMVFVIPPIEEQIAIEAYLQSKFEQTKNLVAIKQQEIDLLTEYKTVLINEAVTGKIKVAS
ncbi:restriction endonuclease subunit S [Psychrobacter sanguinis]|uniref:restriction endonuclease subunit S n=1 Tax=Psychrobacter sanguinis TaxID=861445 RepID=UPI002A75272A|nr:restriction endonuclease subunit S [Psychrobacter sanguinis]MDY3306418.1 restriction endonuclease subunit S [Psychrobacter sanguinis]